MKLPIFHIIRLIVRTSTDHPDHMVAMKEEVISVLLLIEIILIGNTNCPSLQFPKDTVIKLKY